LASIHAVLVGAGFPEPALLSDGRRVMDLLRTLDIHLVLLDLIMPQVEGLELLRQIKTEFPHVECIIFTAVDDVATAIQAMRFGAYDYLVKSLNNEKLVIVITRALERYSLRHELTLHERKQSFADLKRPEAFRHLVARDEAMALVYRQVEVVAPTDYSVVITGESGTGKEMLARVIHALSSRAAAPFMGVNMAAFSRSIFEDEFFGHAKGAYTNAVGERKGFLESAQGEQLTLSHTVHLLPPSSGQPPAANAPPSPGSAFLTLEELEKRHIRDVLEACGGNRVEAARILGVNPSTVYRKIKSYAI
jgi:DNA-binding NtrC family response regulator